MTRLELSFVVTELGMTCPGNRVIHPVTTLVPSVVWQRNRKGLAGIGRMAKHPTSSAWMEAMIPARVCSSIVASPVGNSWQSSESPLTSISMVRWSEVKVSARIDAVSDRTLSAGARSCSES